MELYYETDRYEPPEHLRPALKNVPQRHVDRGAAVKRLDHVNLLATDVAANRRFAPSSSASGLRADHQRRRQRDRRVDEPDDRRARADLRRRPRAPAAAGCTIWRSFVDTREELLRAADLFLDADVPIEAAPSKHAVAQGMFLYVYEPGGNRVEVTTGTHFIYDPDVRPGRVDPGRARPRPGLGGQTIETFHTYGTPDISGTATGPPIPPTSQIPMLSQSVHA